MIWSCTRIEDDFIFTIITNPHDDFVSPYVQILEQHFQETYSPTKLLKKLDSMASSYINDQTHAILIYPRKTLNINAHLEPSQENQLLELLQKRNNVFS